MIVKVYKSYKFFSSNHSPSNLQICHKFLAGCNADTEDKQYRMNKTQLGVDKASGVKMPCGN